VWFALNDRRLTRHARTALESLDAQVFASAASAWEITTKVRLGRWPSAEYLAVNLITMVREMGFTELPVSVSHGQRAGMLPGSHKDPFDRMLIAQALAEDLPIVSGDKVFDEYHVRRIW
jgi:PIN domain nuclease of toxin-antitoxin system